MKPKQRESRCGRCGVPTVEVSGDQRLRFDTRSYDLCEACWSALQSWMSSGERIRRHDGVAA